MNTSQLGLMKLFDMKMDFTCHNNKMIVDPVMHACTFKLVVSFTILTVKVPS